MKKQFLKFMILFMSFAFILLPLNTEAEGKVDQAKAMYEYFIRTTTKCITKALD